MNGHVFLRRPGGPFRPEFWRSPLRGPWLTAVLGLVLLVIIPIVAVTGFLSNDAYYPRLGGNSVGRPLGPLDFYLFPFPRTPSWIYALNQGLHVTLGLAAVPVLLAKLWSVIPRLFEWPAFRSPAHALERLSLAFLVGGALFEFATGILNIQYAYLFHFFFTSAHYYGAWVFTAAFTAHVLIKFTTMRKSLMTRRAVLTVTSDLIAPAPGPETISRRTLLATVGAGSLLLTLQGVGQAIGGPLRRLALFAPRNEFGAGPNGFAVNRTAAAARITPELVDHRWRLVVSGGQRRLSLSRAALLRLPQYSYELPIACVEGWSTTQRWTGVRLRDLANLAGAPSHASATARSIATNGVFDAATLAPQQVRDERTLLALRVGGVDLSLDHGFPARVIGPGIPGVHCTKWVSRLTFEEV
ncbi:MAG: molybdopterin-dependent oxidoreductase [Solirubrobacteraceae bacterium]